MFIKENVKNWLLKECLQSGDPESFFSMIQDAIEEIDEEESDSTTYWDDKAEEIEW